MSGEESQSVRGGSKEEGRWRKSQEIGNGLRMERPRSPCQARVKSSAGECEAGRKGARRSEEAKVPEEGGLTRSSEAKNL